MKLGIKKRIKAPLPVVMAVILTMMTGCGSRTSVVVTENENRFQYVSNQTISLDEDYDIWWHADRLTAEERVWQSEMGEAGCVAVTEDTNMENYGQLEA